MRPSLLLPLMLLSTAALAAPSPYKRALTTAAEALEDARAAARRSGMMCGTATQPLNDAVDAIDGLREGARPAQLNDVRQNLSGLSMAASMSGCPLSVTEGIARATDALEDARRLLYSDRRNDKDKHKHRDDDDGSGAGALYASLAPIKVNATSVWNQEQAVRLSVPELTLTGMKGQLFYMGVRVRSYEGQWSPWVTTQQWSVPNDNFVWKDAFNHFVPYSALAEEDFSDGRFVARVTVFDGKGRELAYRDATFRVRLPRLPDPVVVVQPVVPVRDCGIPNDPGCMMTRNGQYAMDGNTYNGFLVAIRSNSSEMMRTQMFDGLIRSNYMTSAQMGQLMMLISSENTRLWLVQQMAPKVVDPQNAQALAAKFSSSMLSAGFSQMMAQQPPGVLAPVQGVPPHVQVPTPLPYPPGVQPPLPYPPGVQPPPGNIAQSRECMGSDDPACGMSRNGLTVMAPASFNEFVGSLRKTMNEITRHEMATRVFSKMLLSAKQYGIVLDLFTNEITRLEVAKELGGRLANPQSALGFGSKWQNSILGQEYTEMMADQQ